MCRVRVRLCRGGGSLANATASGGGGVSGTSMIPIRVGQLVRFQDQESPCLGTYQGVITYQPDGGDGRDTLSWDTPIHDGSVLVGRLRFTVR